MIDHLAEIAARAGGETAFLRLPERSTVFAERAMRLRQLARGHAMGDFLNFMADLAQAQQRQLAHMPALPLPDREALARAARHRRRPAAAAQTPARHAAGARGRRGAGVRQGPQQRPRRAAPDGVAVSRWAIWYIRTTVDGHTYWLEKRTWSRAKGWVNHWVLDRDEAFFFTSKKAAFAARRETIGFGMRVIRVNLRTAPDAMRSEP
jgi:hypothetical protein